MHPKENKKIRKMSCKRPREETLQIVEEHKVAKYTLPNSNSSIFPSNSSSSISPVKSTLEHYFPLSDKAQFKIPQEDDSIATNSSCVYSLCSICQSIQGQSNTICERCCKNICNFCSRRCEECLGVFCIFCSVVNYRYRWERMECMECTKL